MKLQEFILSNKNVGVKWSIDGTLFTDNNDIPVDKLGKYISSWKVNQWEGIIEINTLLDDL